MRAKPRRPEPSSSGFTLIELLVTIAIAAIVVAVALPDLRGQIQASQARQTARAVKDALDYARQYALNTSSLTTFTPAGCGFSVTADGTPSTVLTSSSGIANWLVNCSGTLGTVSFLGDGSAVTCSSTGGVTTCSPLTSNQTLSVSGGGTTWTVKLMSSGLTSTS